MRMRERERERENRERGGREGYVYKEEGTRRQKKYIYQYLSKYLNHAI